MLVHVSLARILPQQCYHSSTILTGNVPCSLPAVVDNSQDRNKQICHIRRTDTQFKYCTSHSNSKRPPLRLQKSFFFSQHSTSLKANKIYFKAFLLVSDSLLIENILAKCYWKIVQIRSKSKRMRPSWSVTERILHCCRAAFPPTESIKGLLYPSVSAYAP